MILRCPGLTTFFKIVCLSLALAAAQRWEWRTPSSSPMAQRPWDVSTHGLTADGGGFRINGRPLVIFSGSLHYFRVPREYWANRLRALKASGLNTVTTYVAWNFHEEYENEFDYTGDRDIVEFINTAQQMGLLVIVRPGPYICAEWEFGGLPAWLLTDPTMRVRTLHPKFLQSSQNYLNDLLRRLMPLQYTRGGPIIAFQVENEYQSYGSDIKYMKKMQEIFMDTGITELLFCSDGEYLLRRMGDSPLPGLLYSINFQANPENALRLLDTFQPGKAKLVAEFWAGWFDHWGEKHHRVDPFHMGRTVEKILRHNASINFYMFHGGTTFGFMNGANVEKSKFNTSLSLLPDITSYDYDAALSEHGVPSPKFRVIQNLAQKYRIAGSSTANVESVVRSPVGPLQAESFLPLTDLLDWILQPLGEISTPNYVEYICAFISGPCKNPYYGFVAYRHSLADVRADTFLHISGIVGDRMQIIIDGTVMGTVYTGLINQHVNYRVKITAHSRDLILLVENLGRVNFIHLDDQRKGFAGYVTRTDTGGQLTSGWKVYDLGLKPEVVLAMTSPENGRLWKPIHWASGIQQPAFYKFDFFVGTNPTDQFLNFQNWGKGAAFVNSRNLGRYWRRGPQRALYLPAPYIRWSTNTGEPNLG